MQEHNVAKLAFSKLTDILSVVPYCNSFILINRRPAPTVHQSRGGAGVNVTKLFIVVTGIGKKNKLVFCPGQVIFMLVLIFTNTAFSLLAV